MINEVIHTEQQWTKFVELMKTVHQCSEEEAESLLTTECDYFIETIRGDPSGMLINCTGISITGVFLDVLRWGFTFSPQLKMVYVMYSNTTMKQTKTTEMRMTWAPSPDGEIYLRQCAGSIDYVLEPEIVYAGDQYYEEHKEGFKMIHHIPMHQSQQIIAGYTYVVLPNGKREGYSMTIQGDIDRLSKASHAKNGKAPNALYTKNNGQIDTGFFKGKIKKFAVKVYKKKKVVSQFLNEEITE